MKVHRHVLVSTGKNFLPSSILVSKIVNTILALEKAKKSGEVNVVFVDNKKIKKLHTQFLHDKTSTDVIAFSYDDSRSEIDSPFADIYISLNQALINAKRFQEDPRRELRRLIIHGVLHVLGYSDEKPKEKAVMWKRQEALVKIFH